MTSAMLWDMELRHLRYFVTVAEALSFTKAAQQLRLAQPSLTRQVRNLEDEIGVRLLDRSNNRITLTEEGRLFLFDSKKLLAMCAQNVADVQRLNRGESTHLNIGYTASIHSGLLPATLGAFRNGAREWLLETCKRAGFAAKILQEADTKPTAIMFVADALGVALMPETMALPHEGVVFRPFSPPLRRESTIAWRADNPSKPLKEYIQIVKDLSRSM